MQQDLYRNSLHLLETKNARIQQLEDTLRKENEEQQQQLERLSEYDQACVELRAQYPEFENVLITHGKKMQLGKETATPAAADVDTLVVYLETRKAISRTTENRIRNWLKARFKLEDVYVFSKQV